jgi:ribosomal-protein-alanine N-acetyltransferase
VRQLRRLEAPEATDTYSRLQQGALRHSEITKDAAGQIEQEHPELIAFDNANIVVAQPNGTFVLLHYAFANRDTFVRSFPALFDRIVPALDASEAPFGIRLRVTEVSSRAYIEPVLKTHAFELMREWFRMTLAELPEDASADDEIVRGFLLRPAAEGDIEAIAALEASVFPMTFFTPERTASLIQGKAVLRVLEDRQTQQVAGFLHLRSADGGGYISDVAVSPTYQRRGLGKAMLRWSFAWFQKQGMRRASLTVSTDNAGAIALYRELGFTIAQTGLDYRRPVDEDEVRAVLEKNRAQRIHVRRRL